VGNGKESVELVLISDRASRASLLHNVLTQVSVRAHIRTLAPGDSAVNCARRSGLYQRDPPPDLFFFDFTEPDEQSIALLRCIAFGPEKSAVPVILLTSPDSQKLLDEGGIDGGDAVMFSPTSLVSFVRKMQFTNRARFFKALLTLYQFGPILVRAPRSVLCQDRYDLTESA
jgi:DNA-binding response OmpR family regulator